MKSKHTNIVVRITCGKNIHEDEMSGVLKAKVLTWYS